MSISLNQITSSPDDTIKSNSESASGIFLPQMSMYKQTSLVQQVSLGETLEH